MCVFVCVCVSASVSVFVRVCVHLIDTVCTYIRTWSFKERPEALRKQGRECLNAISRVVLPLRHLERLQRAEAALELQEAVATAVEVGVGAMFAREAVRGPQTSCRALGLAIQCGAAALR